MIIMFIYLDFKVLSNDIVKRNPDRTDGSGLLANNRMDRNWPNG